MLKTFLLALLSLVIAIGGGAASVYYAIDAAEEFGTIGIGPWTAYPELGTPEADPYARARFARDGTLALGQSEGIVFTARYDSAGVALGSSCRYRVIGDTPPARFWTLHIIDVDGAIHRVDGRAPAIHSQGLLRAEDGSFEISIARRIQPGNWLRTVEQGTFGLVLTLYDTSVSGSARIAAVELPQIVRGTCDG